MAYRDVKPEETTWEEYGHRMMEKRMKFRGDVKGRRYKRSDATAMIGWPLRDVRDVGHEATDPS